MTPLTPLPPTGLYCIEVPKEAKEMDLKRSTVFYWEGDNIIATVIYLPEGDWQLLGTVTKEEVSFNPSLYIDDTGGFEGNTIVTYRDYSKREKDFTLDTATASLRSLLSSAGIYFDNPMGEKPSDDWDWNDGDSLHLNIEAGIQWQSFQNKLIRGNLLILTKK